MKRIVLFALLLLGVAANPASASFQGDFVLSPGATKKYFQTKKSKMNPKLHPLLNRMENDLKQSFRIWIRATKDRRVSMLTHYVKGNKTTIRYGMWRKVKKNGYRLQFEKKSKGRSFLVGSTICELISGKDTFRCVSTKKNSKLLPIHIQTAAGALQKAISPYKKYTSKMSKKPPLGRLMRRAHRGMSAGRTGKQLKYKDISVQLKKIDRKALARRALKLLIARVKKPVRTRKELKKIKKDALETTSKPLTQEKKKVAAFGVREYTFPPSEAEWGAQYLVQLMEGKAHKKHCFTKWILWYKVRVCGVRNKLGKVRIWADKAEAYLFGQYKLYDVPPSGKDIISWLETKGAELNSTFSKLERALQDARQKVEKWINDEKQKVLRDVSRWIADFVGTQAFSTVMSEIMGKIGSPVAKGFAKNIVGWTIKDGVEQSKPAIIKTLKALLKNTKGAISATKVDAYVSLAVSVGLAFALPPIAVVAKCISYPGVSKYCCYQKEITAQLKMLGFNLFAAIAQVLIDVAILAPISAAVGAKIAAITGGTGTVVAGIVAKIVNVSLNTAVGLMFMGAGTLLDLVTRPLDKYLLTLTGMMMKEIDTAIGKIKNKEGNRVFDLRKLGCIFCATKKEQTSICKDIKVEVDKVTGAAPKGPMCAMYSFLRKAPGTFYQGSDGYVHYRYFDRGRWKTDNRSFRQGGKVNLGLSSTFATQRNHAEVVYASKDGYLKYFFLHRGKWWMDGNTFRKSKVHGEVSVVFSKKERHTQIFARGADGYLQHYSFTRKRGWHFETRAFRKGGKVGGPLSAVYALQRKHAEIFYRGTNGKLRYFFVHKGRWHLDTNTFRHSRVTGLLAAVFNKAYNHSEVFFRGEDGYLHRYYLRGGWKLDKTSFRKGGVVGGDIAVVYDERRKQPSGFYVGTDGRLRFFYYNKSRSRWEVDNYSFRKGGKVVGSISAVYNAKTNHAEAFYRGTDGKVRYFGIKRGRWHLTILP